MTIPTDKPSTTVKTGTLENADPANPSESLVAMSKEVARKWIETRSKTEYRIRVYYGTVKQVHQLPRNIRCFRDGLFRINGVTGPLDLGVNAGFDYLEVWTHDFDTIKVLRNWFSHLGYEMDCLW